MRSLTALVILLLRLPALAHELDRPQLALSFEPNIGQSSSEIQFLARGAGYAVLLTSTGANLVVGQSQPARVGMQLIGADPRGQGRGIQPQLGKSHYLLGNRPDAWRTGIPNYSGVEYRDIYAGVDLIYHGNRRRLEYDFVVHPGADPRVIRMAFDGIARMRLDAQGDLLLETPAGEMRHHKPRVYQDVGGVRREIPGWFRIQSGWIVGFRLGRYDRRQPLVIDPTLNYSTYLGGSATEGGYAIAVDSAGSVYVIGETWSNNFPLAMSYQAANGGDRDVFVTKVNPAGTALVYSTYLGGSDRDCAVGIAVDGAGNAYVTGSTYSRNFPTTPGSFRTSHSGDQDVFVTKLNPAGNSLIYSTLIGGGGSDVPSGIALDAVGSAYVTGYTGSTNFPTTTGALRTNFGGGHFDAFVSKLNPSGSALAYSTFLGGAGDDIARGIGVDAAGYAYVVGHTDSTNFPTQNPLQPANAGDHDLFITKLSPSGNTLVYSTYLGGSGSDFAEAIAVDSAGSAYITGASFSVDFPTTAGCYQPANSGSYDAIVAKLNAAGTALSYSTYLGGSGADYGDSIAVDAWGTVYVIGGTESINFPTANPYQAAYNGGVDAFVTVLDPQRSRLLFSTYLGGSGFDVAWAVALGPSGGLYVAGETFSNNFPTRNAFQPATAGSGDAFVVSFSALDSGDRGCAFSLSPSGQSFPAGGASGTISVAAPDGCNWSASTNTAWITITSGGSGTGAGVAGFSVVANGGALPRTASISIAGSAIQMIQRGAGTALPFGDVPASSPFVDHITLLNANRITGGCSVSPPLYCPDALTNRGQMAVFIVRAKLGDDFSYSLVPYFTDVSASHPFFKYIQKMKELGITSGCSPDRYCPDSAVTRGEMAVFIVRGKLGDSFPYSSLPYFADVPASDPFFRYIQKMRELGVTTGCSATQYCPGAAVTRSQMAVFIIRAFFSPS